MVPSHTGGGTVVPPKTTPCVPRGYPLATEYVFLPGSAHRPKMVMTVTAVLEWPGRSLTILPGQPLGRTNLCLVALEAEVVLV